MKELAIYIHIPFCDHKCIYCDFYSIITTDNIKSYLTALKNEINSYADKLGDRAKVISVFFGGGTPSLMTPIYIGEIINTIQERFDLSESAEITLETNPGTVDREKLIRFREVGINRISIGIQSFYEDDLKFMTRIHNPQTAINTVNTAHEIGFENISIDLIFNLPGQTNERWLKNLEQAVALPITHISPYSLILETGTLLNKMVLDGKVTLQNDDYDADLYETTIKFLGEKGFIQYEVSNFCKPGFQCIHNNIYWHYKEYVGFGTSAHSFVDGIRWKNLSSLKLYIAALQKKGNAICGSEILTSCQKLEEFTMLALRSNGLNKKRLINLFGNEWLEKNIDFINLLIKNQHMADTGEWLKLTPKGYAVCDEILAKFK